MQLAAIAIAGGFSPLAGALTFSADGAERTVRRHRSHRRSAHTFTMRVLSRAPRRTAPQVAPAHS